MNRLLVVSILLCSTCAQAAAPSVEDLAWMTGSWAGPMANGTLEETWSPPKAGTITAMVRMTVDDKISMLELIAITEEEDSLILRMQQFGTDMVPRFSPAQALKLTAMSDNSATFETHTPGGLKQLVYTRDAKDAFSVAVTLTEGTQLRADMTAR